MKVLIVGAGLYGATIASQYLKNANVTVDVIDKRAHIGGNCHDYTREDILVHKYGPHIFHTSYPDVWEFVNKYADMVPFNMRAKSNVGGKLYSFPINLQTMKEVWGVQTPEEARSKIAEVQVPSYGPKNLEEWILSKIGWELYEMFIKDYVIKQWAKLPSELPPFIIQRLPIRFTYDDGYYNDKWVAIPQEGYTSMITNMFKGANILLNTEYERNMDNIYSKIIYTGKLDEFFDYKHGDLEYRSLNFKHKVYDKKDHQGVTMVTYPSTSIKYTRTIEHKYFLPSQADTPKTIVTKEYPADYYRDLTPYYPVNTEDNNTMASYYKELAGKLDSKYLIGGRLGQYKYLDMDKTIKSALDDWKNFLV